MVWWRGRRRISRVSTDREILPLTYRTNATRPVETGNGGVGRLGGNLLSDHRRAFERVCVVAVVRRASRRVVSDARFKRGFLSERASEMGGRSLTNYEPSCITRLHHEFLLDDCVRRRHKKTCFGFEHCAAPSNESSAGWRRVNCSATRRV